MRHESHTVSVCAGCLEELWAEISVTPTQSSAKSGTVLIMSDGIDVTVVLDAEGLRGAIANGATHIELRAHVDLTTLEPLVDGRGLSRDKVLGFLSEEVQTIRVRTRAALHEYRQCTISRAVFLAPHSIIFYNGCG